MLTKFTGNRGPNRAVGDWKCLPLVSIPTRAPFCVSRPQNVSGNALTEHPFFPRGSVKANIGHIEGGSGLAAIVKAILVLEKGIIPPNALFEKLNPNIDADFYNLQVQLPYSQPIETFASYVIRFQPDPFLGRRMACEEFRSTHLVWEELTHTSSSMTPFITFKSTGCLASTTATRPQVTLTGLLPTALPLTDMLSMEPLPTGPRMNDQSLGFSSGLPLTLGLPTACCRLTRAIIRHISSTITASSISWRTLWRRDAASCPGVPLP
jgi:hypothetical protein